MFTTLNFERFSSLLLDCFNSKQALYLNTEKCKLKRTITATRERQAGEIIPVSVEHSATLNSNEAKNAAGLAIDLDLGTRSDTVAGSDGTTWLKVTLDKVYCVEQVIWYMSNGNPYMSWTCTDTDCSNCVSKGGCRSFTLTVSTDEAVSDLSPVSDCKYGDTVKLEMVDGASFVMYEIGIVGKSGKLNTVCT